MIDFDRNGCLEEKSLNKNEKCAVMLYLMAIHLDIVITDKIYLPR